MKTLLLLLVSVAAMGQAKMNEEEAVKKNTIDFTKQYLYFNLTGNIEIDGHTFNNKKSDCPLIYTANLDKVRIIDTCSNIEYVNRKCTTKGCGIIHLEEKSEPEYIINDSPWNYQMPSFTPLPSGIILDSSLIRVYP